jgi:hypothetical protein
MPFILTATAGSLEYLRSYGFQTFSALWDESYDNIADWQKRINRIIQIVRDFDPRALDNPVVQEKLLYNSARFFDKGLRTHLLTSTMINPLLEFVNA